MKLAAPLIDYPEDQFAANIEPWLSAIKAGKITAEQVISKAEQKGKLTDAQKEQIRNPQEAAQ
jgi:hypothetical protein